TARIYTDFSFLTTEPQLTDEVAIVFNTLTGLSGYPGLKKLMVAPFDLKQRLIGLIQRERDHALAGKPARIIAKLNSLVDQEIIKKLYQASCADVTIDLIVRGICCLRPKIPDLSENIRVISIVGRFLEHSRIYYFSNDGQPNLFLSSADWMPRNFLRRVELAFPVENPALRDNLINEVLPRFLNDRVKSREMVSQIKPLIAGWKFDFVSMGFPSPVVNGRIASEPKHLGKGWIGFNFEKALGKPVRLINDAAMQALGSYRGGRMLFLGLGTGLGSTFIWPNTVLPLELGDLPYRDRAIIEDYLGRSGLERLGQ